MADFNFANVTGGSSLSSGKVIDDPNYNDLRGLQKYRLQQNGKTSRIFSINDYKWGEHNALNFADPDSVQKIILEEFQPSPMFDVGRLVDIVLGRTSKIVDGQKTTTTTEYSFIGNIVGGGISSAIQSSLGWAAEKAILANYLANPESAIDFPIKMIKQMLPGIFLNRYELPFFERTYLDTTNSGSWSTQGSSRVLGTALHKILQENMNVDFPTAPTWTCGDNKGKDFKFELYLINDNNDSLVKNFRFLHSLISGTFWMQLSVLQKSPNLYRVTVPGRFIKYFCSIGISSEMVGKLRTNEDVASILNQGTSTTKVFSAINQKTLFPDAYKLELHVQDLTPNNFNNYVNYLINGQNEVVDIGEVNEVSRPTTVLTEINKQLKELNKDTGIKDETEKTISDLSKAFYESRSTNISPLPTAGIL